MIINTSLQALMIRRGIIHQRAAMGRPAARIASGYRINSAADDAAGLSIVSRKRAQIISLHQAGRNIQDGISLSRTVSGALSEANDILNRMRELAVQAASDTLTAYDRFVIQREFRQLGDELDRIANTTNFNGMQVLDGSASIVASTNSALLEAVYDSGSLKPMQEAAASYDVIISTAAGTGQVKNSHVMGLNTGTSALDVITRPENNLTSGLSGFQSRGLAPGDYRIQTRAQPFGRIDFYDQDNNLDTALESLGAESIRPSTTPNLMPFGVYTIETAAEVPFMATFADFALPGDEGFSDDIIRGVDPTNRDNVSFTMDIDADQPGPINAQSQLAWADFAFDRQVLINPDGNSNNDQIAFSTDPSQVNNIYTYFQAGQTSDRVYLIDPITAETYYRSVIGSEIELDLTYVSAADAAMDIEATYRTAENSRVDMDLTYMADSLSALGIKATYVAAPDSIVRMGLGYLTEAGTTLDAIATYRADASPNDVGLKLTYMTEPGAAIDATATYHSEESSSVDMELTYMTDAGAVLNTTATYVSDQDSKIGMDLTYLTEAGAIDATATYLSDQESALGMELSYITEADAALGAQATYRAGAGSNINLNLDYVTESGSEMEATATYQSQEGETITARTSYLFSDDSKFIVTWTEDNNGDSEEIVIEKDLSGKNLSEAVDALNTAFDEQNISFELVDGDDIGEKKIRVENDKSSTITISGSAAVALGLGDEEIEANGDKVSDSLDYEKGHEFNVGGKNLEDIAGEVSFTGDYSEIKVEKEAHADGIYYLEVINNSDNYRLSFVDNSDPDSVMAELGLNDADDIGPGDDAYQGQKVYHNYSFTVDGLGGLTIGNLADSLQSKINHGNADVAGISNFIATTEPGGDFEQKISFTNNSIYNITLTDKEKGTAGELDLHGTVINARGGEQDSSFVYDGWTESINVAGDDIEQIKSRIDVALSAAMENNNIIGSGSFLVDADEGDERELSFSNVENDHSAYRLNINTEGDIGEELGFDSFGGLNRGDESVVGLGKTVYHEKDLEIELFETENEESTGLDLDGVRTAFANALVGKLNDLAVSIEGDEDGVSYLRVDNTGSAYELTFSEVQGKAYEELGFNSSNKILNRGGSFDGSRLLHNYSFDEKIDLDGKDIIGIAAELNAKISSALEKDDHNYELEFTAELAENDARTKSLRLRNETSPYRVTISDVQGSIGDDLGFSGFDTLNRDESWEPENAVFHQHVVTIIIGEGTNIEDLANMITDSINNAGGSDLEIDGFTAETAQVDDNDTIRQMSFTNNSAYNIVLSDGSLNNGEVGTVAEELGFNGFTVSNTGDSKQSNIKVLHNYSIAENGVEVGSRSIENVASALQDALNAALDEDTFIHGEGDVFQAGVSTTDGISHLFINNSGPYQIQTSITEGTVFADLGFDDFNAGNEGRGENWQSESSVYNSYNFQVAVGESKNIDDLADHINDRLSGENAADLQIDGFNAGTTNGDNVKNLTFQNQSAYNITFDDHDENGQVAGIAGELGFAGHEVEGRIGDYTNNVAVLHEFLVNNIQTGEATVAEIAEIIANSLEQAADSNDALTAGFAKDDYSEGGVYNLLVNSDGPYQVKLKSGTDKMLEELGLTDETTWTRGDSIESDQKVFHNYTFTIIPDGSVVIQDLADTLQNAVAGEGDGEVPELLSITGFEVDTQEVDGDENIRRLSFTNNSSYRLEFTDSGETVTAEELGFADRSIVERTGSLNSESSVLHHYEIAEIDLAGQTIVGIAEKLNDALGALELNGANILDKELSFSASGEENGIRQLSLENNGPYAVAYVSSSGSAAGEVGLDGLDGSRGEQWESANAVYHEARIFDELDIGLLNLSDLAEAINNELGQVNEDEPRVSGFTAELKTYEDNGLISTRLRLNNGSVEALYDLNFTISNENTADALGFAVEGEEVSRGEIASGNYLLDGQVFEFNVSGENIVQLANSLAEEKSGEVDNGDLPVRLIAEAVDNGNGTFTLKVENDSAYRVTLDLSALSDMGFNLEEYQLDRGQEIEDGEAVFHEHEVIENLSVAGKNLEKIRDELEQAITGVAVNGTSLSGLTVGELQGDDGISSFQLINSTDGESIYSIRITGEGGEAFNELGFNDNGNGNGYLLQRGSDFTSKNLLYNYRVEDPLNSGSVDLSRLTIVELADKINASLKEAAGKDDLSESADEGEGSFLVRAEQENGEYRLTIDNIGPYKLKLAANDWGDEIGLDDFDLLVRDSDLWESETGVLHQHSFEVGLNSQTLDQIIDSINVALEFEIDDFEAEKSAAGDLHYINIDNSSTIYDLSFTDSVGNTINELGLDDLNELNGTPNVLTRGDSFATRRVYDGHTVYRDIGDRRIDSIKEELTGLLEDTLAEDALDNSADNFFSLSGDGDTRRLDLDNSNTLYRITINDRVESAASELGLQEQTVERGGTFTSGTEVDYGKELGRIEGNNNDIEDLHQWINSMEGDWLEANWLSGEQPGNDGDSHYGQFVIVNNDQSVNRREVVFLSGEGTEQLFDVDSDTEVRINHLDNAGTDIGNTRDSERWQARDNIEVQASYVGLSNDGTIIEDEHTATWWRGDLGTSNDLIAEISDIPFDSIFIPDEERDVSNRLNTGDRWALYTHASAGDDHFILDTRFTDHNTGQEYAWDGEDGELGGGYYVFEDGVLNDRDISIPQMIREEDASYETVDHNIEFGTVDACEKAVVYSQCYSGVYFDHYAHAYYGNDTTYYFQDEGLEPDDVLDIEVWRQENSNASLLLTYRGGSTFQVEGRAYDRDGAFREIEEEVTISSSTTDLNMGDIHFDRFNVQTSALAEGDKFVVNVAARAGQGAYGDEDCSDEHIAITGNPWLLEERGSSINYRFDQGVVAEKTFDLLGYFVDPLFGFDDTIGVRTGRVVIEVGEDGFIEESRVGGHQRAVLEVNHHGTTDHIAAALLTGHYFQDIGEGETYHDFLEAVVYEEQQLQNAAVMFEVIEEGENQVALRAQAHIYDRDGKYRYDYQDLFYLGRNNEDITLFGDCGDGLTFSRIEFEDLSRLQRGDRFSMSLAANAEPDTSSHDEVYLWGSEYLEQIHPHSWRFNNGVLDNSTTILRTYQVDRSSGKVYDSENHLTFGDFHGGTEYGVEYGLEGHEETPRDIPDTVRFSSVEGQFGNIGTAHRYTALSDIAQFYTTEGRFLLDNPAALTIHQGDQSARVMLYGKDTIMDVVDRINRVIYEDLGQKELVASDDRYKFVSYVNWPNQNSELDVMEGSMVVRSALPGQGGELVFSGSEDLLKGLGFNVIRESEENIHTIDIKNRSSGEAEARGVEISGNVAEGLLPGVTLQLDIMLGLDRAEFERCAGQFRLVAEQGETVYVRLTDRRKVLQVGANPGQVARLDLGSVGREALNIVDISVITRELANRAIAKIDNAVAQVSGQRSNLGALENRLEHNATNVAVAAENLTNAESRIRDADIAREFMRYLRSQLISQVGMSILNQANMQRGSVLQLIH